METVRDVALFVGGLVLVVVVLDSALRTFVLPRGATVRLTRAVSVLVRRVFDLRLRWARSYEARDRVMALFGPIAMFALVVLWMVMVVGGFTMIFVAVENVSWKAGFLQSGSSLFTLGFEPPIGFWAATLGFAEAAIGLGLLALLIAYLPTIYGAFSRREVLVAHMSARAGSPPSAVDLLRRAHLIGRIDNLDDVWVDWQLWFAELQETHTSLAFVNFFRSPEPDRSWITAAGAVLDAAALTNSTIAGPNQPMASLCVRSGFTALRSIARFFNMPHPEDPAPDDPISLSRDEWEDACRELEAAGVPLRDDRDQAWRDFAGWRVNYDVPLVMLAGLLVAPYAPWSSDRSIPFKVRIIRRS
ncbi:MAG: hypothetical protein ACXVJW_16195 [Acidimicrobiia bacterium]